MTRLKTLLAARFALTGLALLLSVATAPAARAQDPAPAASTAMTPATNLFNRDAKPLDTNAVPILSSIVKGGAKLYYLGERSGLHGWFILKNNQIQVVYVTADGKTSLFGGMFTGEGENVTAPQITVLSEKNKEIAELINGTGKQTEEISQAGSVPGGTAAVPGQPDEAKDNMVAKNLPTMPLSPGERLIHDLQAAAGVTLGHNDNAEILMVIDTTCSHCKATWKELRESVLANRVQVRLIPVVNSLSGNGLHQAGQLLQASNPLEAWDKFVNGDKEALSGEVKSVHTSAIMANRALTDRWNIQATPYLVYRAKDGRVKIVQGKPERMAAVLSDLLK